MSGQKTMTERKQEMMERMWKYPGGIRVDMCDKKVLKRLVNDGRARITKNGTRAPWVNGRKHVMASHSLAVAIEAAPVKEEVPYTGGPYAKRRGYAEIAGHSYRGKTHGKIRVDKPREEREAKEVEKKKMWALLKHHKY